ncbi:hypothetical protein H6F86_20555 [Phormidium sp. FACHB-592]|uniref:Uncharacterized protein n=1 Tax=Stenomitos frigidus AS-A4 TaxID=2933935 RepID=A0ABV0KH16_9CYAN|nr:hypothetical protein [Phormidium sp. FACHB-592]MBD2076224.1 hypothetical protein [Phormidium sp. FACHB-592]
MTNGFFQKITGPEFDGIMQSVGMRPEQVRYGETKVIKPVPLLTISGLVNITAIQAPGLTDGGEYVQAYEASIPLSTLTRSFGRDGWQSAIAPGQIWYVNLGDGTGWRRCRTYAEATTGVGMRYGVKLAEMGLGDWQTAI